MTNEAENPRWSIHASPSIGKSIAKSVRESLPTTTGSGGLYDLDTLDEDLVRASTSAYTTEPKLDKLRALNKNRATFKDMIRAADADAKAHASQMREMNESHNHDYSSNDYAARMERAKLWDDKAAQLKREAGAILRAFDKPLNDKGGETAAEVAKERLTRWQRALELYVCCPEEDGIDLLKLLEKLIEGCGEVRCE